MDYLLSREFECLLIAKVSRELGRSRKYAELTYLHQPLGVRQSYNDTVGEDCTTKLLSKPLRQSGFYFVYRLILTLVNTTTYIVVV